MNIPPFEGRYVPDIYLTWELETEQRFTCYNIPRRDVFLLLFVHSLVLHVFGGLSIVDYSLRSELLVAKMDVSRRILVLNIFISEINNSERRSTYHEYSSVASSGYLTDTG